MVLRIQVTYCESVLGDACAVLIKIAATSAATHKKAHIIEDLNNIVFFRSDTILAFDLRVAQFITRRGFARF